MTRARRCKACGTLTQHNRCTCGHQTTLCADVHLGKSMGLDVTITLRLDHANNPFILVQKPSGQDRVELTHDDTI
jgi:hypothetical protein